ncbi:RrF2 family transcriptional regulator [Lachnoclostridium sp. Marseille-P6806]|uniref:RrF2 family transcriptional regulator n=1 Tax=Lachnoclostridium sp. Marseille-P6806 TaxID=2364793 RepID=UPI001031250D|nr:Rrf2 family transcriptional regulator [Lachnoclostridium sp. Marseille-P6806]
MKVSTKGRYAFRMMVDLGVHNTGEFISLKDISRRQGITVKYLEQIVTTLTRSGFLRSQRGNNGGYRLAREPKEYTVGEILRVMEGPLSPVACLDDPDNICPRSAMCATLPFWQGLDQVIREYVDRFTLQDILDQMEKQSGGDYCI